MKRKVFWSEEAEIQITKITNYLRENWSGKSAENFLDILHEKILLLSLFPEMCELSASKKGIRRCVITKQVSILYGFTKTQLNIYSIIDNRQENN